MAGEWHGLTRVFNVFFNTVIGLCWSENWVFLPNVWPFYGEKEFIIKFGSTYHISRHTNLEVGPCRAVNWLGQPTFAISNHIKPSISGKKSGSMGMTCLTHACRHWTHWDVKKIHSDLRWQHKIIPPWTLSWTWCFWVFIWSLMILLLWSNGDSKSVFFLHPTNHGLRGASEEKMISVWWFWFSALGV